MAKKMKVNEEVLDKVADKIVDDIMTADPTTLTKEQLAERYDANVAERKRLAEENKLLVELYRAANKVAKQQRAEKQIAEAMAKLEALKAAAVSAGAKIEETLPEVTSELAPEVASEVAL